MPGSTASGRARRARKQGRTPFPRGARAGGRRSARRDLRGRRAARADRFARRHRFQRPRRLRRRLVGQLRRRRAGERHLAGADVSPVHRRRRRCRADARGLPASGVLRVRASRGARALARRARDAAGAARSVPPRHDGVAGDAVARGSHGHVRQPVDRPLSCTACSPPPGRTERFPQARPQALPRRDQSRHRRVRDLRRAAGATTFRSRRRSRRRRRCPASSRRCGSAASISSTARSTRRCTRRSRSTKASTCCCASIRSCRSTRAARRATAASPSTS